MSILVFDSGIGGLTVLREARVILPDHGFIYVGDDEGFPYGDWPEQQLVDRLLTLFGALLERFNVELAVVACNTASTAILPALRAQFDVPFVGTVPAIKPAAERTASGMVSVLATPGTINRDYTHRLISEFADNIEVNLVASSRLAPLAEAYMQGRSIDRDLLRSEIAPCFQKWAGRQTDIVVLGCTHYPFLVNEMRKLAPWPVDWIDPAEAIARRALGLLSAVENSSTTEAAGQSVKVALQEDDDIAQYDIALMSSADPSDSVRRLLQGFGLRLLDEPILHD